MKKFYFTRKNFIEIALVFFFFILFLFVFASVDAGHAIMAKDNPIEALYLSLRLPAHNVGFSGYVTAILVVVFMTIADIMVVFLRRFAKFRQEKFVSLKWISLSLVAVIVSVALSVGVGVTYLALDGRSVAPLLSVLGSSLFVTILLATFIGAIILGAVSIYVNFKNIDKPYRYFNVVELEDLEKEIDAKEVAEQVNQSDLAAQFGETISSEQTTSMIHGGVGSATSNDSIGLSDRETVFPGLSGLDVEFGGFVAETRKKTETTLEDLCTNFRLYLADDEGLFFDIQSIRAFVSSFAASRIIILEGLSGTGKSSLPRYFAKFIKAILNFIPVQTTWRDKTSLIGYFNDFTQTFSETDFLKGLYRASYDRDVINLMVLDEFNIARVEYYFADFLSILEYPENEQVIKIMQLPFDFVPPTHLQDGQLALEPSTFFVCTANKDDSTYSISDKVYDRAIILDFDDKNEPFVAKSKVKHVPIGFTELTSLYKTAKAVEGNNLSSADLKKFLIITDFVREELDVTFGNRIMHQINEFVPVFVACGGTKEEALDFLFTRKILTKVQGRFEDYIRAALLNLDKLIVKQYGSRSFSGSRHLIATIIKRL